MRRSTNVFPILSISLVLSLCLSRSPARAIEIGPSNGETPVWHQSVPISQNLGKEGIWDGYPLLKRICGAESAGGPENKPRQFDDGGSPLWGWEKHGVIYARVQRDVGACQINTWVHAGDYEKMGLDVIHSEADNIAFAKWLFDTQGWHPWIASKTMQSGNGWDQDGLIQ
jgi:hypothetical protein